MATNMEDLGSALDSPKPARQMRRYSLRGSTSRAARALRWIRAGMDLGAKGRRSRRQPEATPARPDLVGRVRIATDTEKARGYFLRLDAESDLKAARHL